MIEMIIHSNMRKTTKQPEYSSPTAAIFEMKFQRCVLADSNNLSAGSLYDGLDTEDEDFFTK